MFQKKKQQRKKEKQGMDDVAVLLFTTSSGCLHICAAISFLHYARILRIRYGHDTTKPAGDRTTSTNICVQ
jgi:hypothetical protein